VQGVVSHQVDRKRSRRRLRDLPGCGRHHIKRRVPLDVHDVDPHAHHPRFPSHQQQNLNSFATSTAITLA
jgi:hypothetical protein